MRKNCDNHSQSIQHSFSNGNFKDACLVLHLSPALLLWQKLLGWMPTQLSQRRKGLWKASQGFECLRLQDLHCKTSHFALFFVLGALLGEEQSCFSLYASIAPFVFFPYSYRFLTHSKHVYLWPWRLRIRELYRFPGGNCFVPGAPYKSKLQA